jgi:hypothetical protein
MTATPKPLPPLSHPVLKSILRLQDAATRALTHCKYPGTDTLNVDRALEVLCGYAIEEAKLRLDFYENQPSLAEKHAAKIGIVAAESILACFPQYKFIISGAPPMMGLDGEIIYQYEDPRQFTTQVSRAVLKYIDRRFDANENPYRTPQLKTRKQLRDEYFAHFPDERIVIRDLCWAAGQHYREWIRWLGNDPKTKDGYAADLAFRGLLTSMKRPQEYKAKPRPAGWA